MQTSGIIFNIRKESPSDHAISFYYIKLHNNQITNDNVYDDFPKISDYHSKISEESPKVVRRPHDVSEYFPKMSEDY